MIDSHAHITSEFYNNIDKIIELLKENNVIKVLNCGSSIDSSNEVILLANKHSILLPCVGIHPESINEINKIGEIEKLIRSNKIYAVGEIGLDYYWNKENKEEQKKLFIEQLLLAEKYNLPVIIHTRESIQDCFDILKNRKNRGVIHCFSGSYEMAKEFIKIGYKIGIGGVLTFKNSKLPDVINKIDLENILIETDSPFLSPEPHRGEKNIPSNVYFVAKKIAEIKSTSIEKVIEKTSKNACELFDI